MHAKFIAVFFLLAVITGCAKTAYVIEQTSGQISLQWKGRKNSEVLADPDVLPEHKEKIRLVETYREYFFQYWQRKPDSIYSKTTILEDEAVSWLVITAPWNRVKAQQECFPFVGCFPYIGFFKKSSAVEWIEDKKKEGFHTWLRPVYAYSTLGHFEDRILSSFFSYDRYELAELVFHELFHVMYFLKDNVDFNENIANFFGEKMAYEYFADQNDAGFEKWKEEMKAGGEIRRTVARAAKELDQIYQEKNPSQEEAQLVMQEYIENSLRPNLRQACIAAKLKNCKIADQQWNNARLAATLTYEKAAPDFERLYREHGQDLRQLLDYIKEREKQFHQSEQKNFTDFLFSDTMERP